MSVLALALRRREMSQRDIPSTVPAGQALEDETNGTRGTLGTGGTVGTIRTVTTADPKRFDAEATEERAGLAADRVPPIYLDTWARLNHQKPARVSEVEWRLALDDGERFLDAYGSDAAEMQWTPGELFDVSSGLIWRLAGKSVELIGADHVRLRDGRTISRGTERDLRVG